MITATSNTTQTYSYAQTSSNNQAKNSTFDETLEATQTSKSSEVLDKKKVEKMSFEFIKNLKGISEEEFNSIYSDFSEEEKQGILSLNSIANFTENDIFNKVLFDKTRKELPLEKSFASLMQKESEINKFLETGDGHYFIIDSKLFEKDQTGKLKFYNNLEDKKKITHEEAFNFLVHMVNSSKEGMEASKGELQQLYTESYNEYNQFLNNYNKELRKNMTGRA